MVAPNPSGATPAPGPAPAPGIVALPVVATVAALRGVVAEWRAAGHTVALIPTMGALHEGHLELVRRGLAACDRTVVSIFVNPKQFGPREDFATYPRTMASDAAMLRAVGAHLIFAPDVALMYPDGFATTVTVAGVTEGLCGAHRPGHFAGVATVVAKLLIQAWPDVAVFGEKDYQQLLTIRRLARDLDLPVEILAVPTVREPDGLALSSRNAYLSPAERQIAARLYATLADLKDRLEAAATTPERAAAEGRERLLGAGFDAVDYVELRRAADLRPLDEPRGEARLLAAARIGGTRLIDNVPVYLAD
jgi:pantoate--beta-alanine ligase